MSGIMGIDTNIEDWEAIEDASGIMQPRGDEWGGFATVQNGDIKRGAKKGKIIPILEEEKEKLKNPRKVIIHVNQNPENPQPAKIKDTPMGPIAVAFDGKIINKEELKEKSPYLIGSEAGIIARLIAAKKDPIDGLKNVYRNIKGPFSLVLLTLDGIFAARDVLGVRPMVIARFLGDSKIGCAVASESAGLTHIGMELTRDVRPGEIISIESNGFKTIEKIPGPGLMICGFEYGYWARTSSIIEDIWVGEARRKAGEKLASNCPKADRISSFPMSGNAAAEGLHQASGIPYQSVFDYNYEAGGRSFLPFDSEVRIKRAKNKLIIMPWAVKGKKIVMVDDSIVEGNQTLRRIHIVKKAGAEEIHLLIETPPMKHPCPFDNTPRGELIATNHSIEEIRKILGVDTLNFQEIDSYADSILSSQSEERKEKDPLKIENICLGCFTGNFPVYPNLA